MSKIKWNQNSVIRGAIRRTFARSPVIREIMMENRKEFPKFNKDGSRAKKDAVCYLCNVCKKYVSSTKISVDHIEPVISVDEGFIDWNEFVNRLYCGKENLQVICDDCHQVKTNKERFERTLKKETAELNRILKNINEISKEDIKFIKKFTSKRLQKYPESIKMIVKEIKGE